MRDYIAEANRFMYDDNDVEHKQVKEFLTKLIKNAV